VEHTDVFHSLVDTLKVAVAALREKNVSFMLGGSVAAWARGGPEPQKDLDLMVTPEDADAALEALTEAGMRPEKPPEEWLYKAWHGDVMVDLIFCPSGLELTDEVLDRAERMPVMSIETPVMAVEDMLLTMLLSLDEHRLDYSPILGIVRSLREQIDWSQLRTLTSSSPYAKAFFTLCEELGICEPSLRRAAGASRVRVLPGGAVGPSARSGPAP
jgi:hypothetical protein